LLKNCVLSFRGARSASPESITSIDPGWRSALVLQARRLWIPGSGLRPAPE
jgi:hypothetical protein